MRKAGNPGRPGNGSPGMKTLFRTLMVAFSSFVISWCLNVSLNIETLADCWYGSFLHTG